MMKGTGKIKNKIAGIKEMSNDKAQSPNETRAISNFNNRSFQVQNFEPCLPPAGRHRQVFSYLNFKHLLAFEL
jgi:hypothetical protein